MPESPASAALSESAPHAADGEHRVTVSMDADERIHTLDILRGLALFGMILVHFHQNMRLESSGLEDLIPWGVWIFVEQKAWGTFAFLFGVGFAVLLRRLEMRGDPVVPIYLRRLGALACFGVIAQVGFGFAILFEYAYWGLALLLIRRLPTTWAFVVAIASACASPVITLLSALRAHSLGVALPPTGYQESVRALAAAAQSGSYLTLLAARWHAFLHALPHDWHALVPGMNLALFVLGMLALRCGVLEHPKRHRRIIAGAMTFGAVSWGLWWVVTLIAKPHLPLFGIPGIEGPLLGGLGLVNDQWLSLTYVGALVLLLAYRPDWISRLALFGSAGRMALTNYMIQVMTLDVLASSYGFGLKLRPYTYVVAAILLFGCEVAFSRAWLARFRFGPLEWLWRSITYAKRQPLRRREPKTLVVAAA